jgi:hypothetical protein
LIALAGRLVNVNAEIIGGNCTERRLIAGRLDIFSSTGGARKSVVDVLAVVGFLSSRTGVRRGMITWQSSGNARISGVCHERTWSQPIKLLAHVTRRRVVSVMDQHN